jgi:hypothetical protein
MPLAAMDLESGEQQVGEASSATLYEVLIPSPTIGGFTQVGNSEAENSVRTGRESSEINFATVHEARTFRATDNSGSNETKNSDDRKNSNECTERNGMSSRHITEYGGIIGNWWFEVLCLATMVLALLAIALTLSTQQERPLSHWPYKVSLNSLVATYAVILKGAILFIATEGMYCTYIRRPRYLLRIPV